MNKYPVVHIDHDFLFPYSGMVFDSSQIYYRDLFEDCRINNTYVVIWNTYDGKNNMATLAKVHNFEIRPNNEVLHHIIGIKKCRIIGEVEDELRPSVKVEEVYDTLKHESFNVRMYENVQKTLRNWISDEAPDLSLRKAHYDSSAADVSIIINRIIDFVVKDQELKFIFMNTHSLNEQLNLVGSFFKNNEKAEIDLVATEAIKSYYLTTPNDFIQRYVLS